MSAIKLIPAVAIFLLVGSGPIMALAQSTVKKEIDVSFAPLEVVKPILDPVLSPQGKFLMLAKKGGVLVIDTPQGIIAAEAAIAAANLTGANVALEFQFVTGLPTRHQSLTVAQEVPFPVEFAPPTIIVGQSGVMGFIPATPTKFQTRNIGVTSESVSTVNPDGSITLDINTESSALEGFVQYGSAMLPSGQIGAVPVLGQVGNPTFFTPWINTGGISLPVISTTRVTTSVVIRPKVVLGVVHLDIMPRLTVKLEGSEMEPEVIDVKQYYTAMEVPNNGVARVYGFQGADDDFNRQFFGADDPATGGTALVVKAVVQPPVGKN